jgi:Glyoxalase/Bleomycin resistance protein/Dioxygenase superfamily
VIDPQLRESEDLLAASITLDDAKPLFLEFQAAGGPFHQPLKTEPWGARTFIVRDPDGNLILFVGRGEQSKSARDDRGQQVRDAAGGVGGEMGRLNRDVCGPTRSAEERRDGPGYGFTHKSAPRCGAHLDYLLGSSAGFTYVIAKGP